MQPLSPATTPASLPDTATGVLDAIHPLLWFIRRHMRRHRQNLSVPQFVALIKLQKDPALSLSTVAEHLGASLPTASRVVSSLITRGYLTRHTCADDRRACRLNLTPRGLKIVGTARAATQAGMEAVLASLSPGQRACIFNSMHTLRALFEPLLQRNDDPHPATVAPAPTKRSKTRTQPRPPARRPRV